MGDLLSDAGKPVLSPELLREMAEHNPIGMALEPADVEAWIDSIWLVFREHGYKEQKRALLNWWRRVTEEEILRARSARLRRQAEAEDRRLAEAAAQVETNVVPIQRRYFSGGKS